jgi:hypothetical protein
MASYGSISGPCSKVLFISIVFEMGSIEKAKRERKYSRFKRNNISSPPPRKI